MASEKDDPLAEETLSSRVAFEGVFLRLFQDRVRAADGHVGIREYVQHPGAVTIVALLANGHVVLERQFRHPLRRTMIEIPAGKIDPGEALLACAQRELREETGYAAATWVHLGGFHNAFGYSDERIDVFLARDLTRQNATQDAGEVIDVFTAPWQDVCAWIRDGKVTDVKTIIGIGWLEKWLDGKWKPD
ncbi:MAG: NUDIX domain-containing protein [Burkholderiales bacterium]